MRIFNSLIVPKNVKGSPLGFSTSIQLQNTKKHRRKGICARLRATGPAAIIDYHHVHLNHITKLLAMTNS